MRLLAPSIAWIISFNLTCITSDSLLWDRLVRNTMRNVTTDQTVFMISCHVSEKWKTGPLSAHATIRAAAIANAGVLPVQRATARARRWAIDSRTSAIAVFSEARGFWEDMRIPSTAVDCK